MLSSRKALARAQYPFSCMHVNGTTSDQVLPLNIGDAMADLCFENSHEIEMTEANGNCNETAENPRELGNNAGRTSHLKTELCAITTSSLTIHGN